MTLEKKLQWNLDQNTKSFIIENASENVVCEIWGHFVRGGGGYCLRYGVILHIVVARLACASQRYSYNAFCEQSFAIFIWDIRVGTWSKINLVKVA